MSAAACPREAELLAALVRGFLDADLIDHSAACAACRELRRVAGALLEERAAAVAEAPVPAAGTMWWRLQLRRRQEARAAARRVLLVGQAATLLLALGLLVTLFGSSVRGVVQQVAAQPLDHPLLLGLAALLLVVPVGGWLAIRQK